MGKKKPEEEFMSFDELIQTHDLEVYDPDERAYRPKHQRRVKFWTQLLYWVRNIIDIVKEELWRFKKF